MGSLLPLSNSSIEAVLSLRFSFLERNIENTEAASVEPIIEPMASAATQLISNT